MRERVYCTSGVCPGDDAVDMLLIAVAVDDDESDRLGLATMDGSRPIVLSRHSTSLMVAGRNMAATTSLTFSQKKTLFSSTGSTISPPK